MTFDPSNEIEEDLWREDQVVALTFNLTNADSWAVLILNETLIFKRSEIKKGTPKQLHINGAIVGVNDVQVSGKYSFNNCFSCDFCMCGFRFMERY